MPHTGSPGGAPGTVPPGGTSPGGPAPGVQEYCLVLDNFLEPEMLPHTISYAKVNGRNTYGAPTFDTPTDYRARVIWRGRRVIDKASGNETLSSGEVWVNGVLDELKPDDRITLPDGIVPVILTWHIICDENDCRFTKVFFGVGGGGRI